MKLGKDYLGYVFWAATAIMLASAGAHAQQFVTAPALSNPASDTLQGVRGGIAYSSEILLTQSHLEGCGSFVEARMRQRESAHPSLDNLCGKVHWDKINNNWKVSTDFGPLRVVGSPNFVVDRPTSPKRRTPEQTNCMRDASRPYETPQRQKIFAQLGFQKIIYELTDNTAGKIPLSSLQQGFFPVDAQTLKVKLVRTMVTDPSSPNKKIAACSIAKNEDVEAGLRTLAMGKLEESASVPSASQPGAASASATDSADKGKPKLDSVEDVYSPTVSAASGHNSKAYEGQVDDPSFEPCYDGRL